MDERLLDEAARWHARLAAENCTDLDRANFQRWRVTSPRHARAYQRAEALSAQLARWGKLDAELKALADAAFADAQPAARSARRWMVPAALAASIAVAFVGMRLSGYLSAAAPPVTYASTEETRREVRLDDGSIVHLDVGSEISVRYALGQRGIVLVNGRALFEVAHDAARPFVVAAGQSRTTALGTHFQVQREGRQVLVTLTEGSIAVASDVAQAPWQERLSPGEQISLSADGRMQAKRVVDAQAVTSWSRGRLVFRGTPLGDALQEVNRYGTRKVRLGDAELAELPVDGNFIAGETDLIVSAFVAALPLRVAEGSVGEIILFRRYKADVP